MRLEPRTRHPVSPVALALIRPLLRYSYTREAYVLRIIGSRHGPVLVRSAPSPPDGREDAAG